jgi:hypothetical protein
MPKKKLNADEKKERLAGALSLFVQRYGRKAQRGVEPNDRKYSRKTALKIKKHLKPTVMDALLRDDDTH